MKDLLKRVLFTGLGAVVITKERLEEMIHKLINEGEMSQEEGSSLINEFQSRVKKEQEWLVGKIKEELEKRYSTAGLVSKGELELLRLEMMDLSVRIKELEEKMVGEEQGD